METINKTICANCVNCAKSGISAQSSSMTSDVKMNIDKTENKDYFPTALEAAASVQNEYAHRIIATIKGEILKQVADKQYQTPINVRLPNNFTKEEEEPIFKATVTRFFQDKEYNIYDWKIGTYKNDLGYMCYGSLGLTCRISWIPK